MAKVPVSEASETIPLLLEGGLVDRTARIGKAEGSRLVPVAAGMEGMVAEMGEEGVAGLDEIAPAVKLILRAHERGEDRMIWGAPVLLLAYAPANDPTGAESTHYAVGNLMLAAACGIDSEIIELSETQKTTLAPLTKKFSTPLLVGALGILAKLSYNIRGSSLARPLVEAAIVRLAEAEKFVDPQSLIQRLQDIADCADGPEAEKKKPVGRPTVATESAPRPQQIQSPAAPAAPAATEVPEVQAAQPPAVSRQPLSTTEKQKMHEDPVVREVLSLFGGEIIDIRRCETHPVAGPLQTADRLRGVRRPDGRS